jgi:glycosyltransferase involved in cell wall biosynthesis
MTAAGISVLLVTHNHADYIDRALASIENQVSSSTFEVVVADDASTDGTRDVILAWQARVPFDVRVLPEEPRLGITRNYERGFRACTGRYVAVLEGDDEWLSVEKLELQARHLDEHPDIVVVANRFLLHNQNTGESCPRPLIGTEQFWTRLTSEQLAESNWFGTFSTCMFRADALARISPEVFGATSFDWMINLAITEHGDAALLPEVTALYRVHSGGAWSGLGDIARAKQLRELIPTYMSLLGGRLDRQLSVVLADVEQQLHAAGPEAPPLPPPGAREPEPTIALPAVVSKTRPRVSVVMTSYNHGKYLREAVDSVLAQTMTDLELIIVDDDSRDGSLAVMGRLREERIRAYALRENIGAAAALNFAIQQARGEFVAVINSDDRWEPHKLARQLEVFAQKPHVGAVFTGVQLIDERGRTLAPNRIPAWAEVFEQPNRTQGQWLRFFMAYGNALCHPSVLLRRETYRLLGLYDNTLRQLPDLDRWIALVKHAPIEVLGDEPLVHFRTFARHSNASGLSAENIVRTYHEHLVVNESYFDDMTTDLLIDGFSDLMRSHAVSTPVEIDCVIAFLWLDCVGSLQTVNLEQALTDFRRLLRDPTSKLHLKTQFGFTDRSLHALAARSEHVRKHGAHTLGSTSVTTDRTDGRASTGSTLGATLRAMRSTPLRQWPPKIRRRIAARRWRNR